MGLPSGFWVRPGQSSGRADGVSDAAARHRRGAGVGASGDLLFQQWRHMARHRARRLKGARDRPDRQPFATDSGWQRHSSA